MSKAKDAKSFNNPERATLQEVDVGRLGQAILTLTKELWVLRDRVTVLEAVLADKGVEVTHDVDHYQPSEEMQKQLDEQSKALVEAVLGAISGTEKSE